MRSALIAVASTFAFVQTAIAQSIGPVLPPARSAGSTQAALFAVLTSGKWLALTPEGVGEIYQFSWDPEAQRLQMGSHFAGLQAEDADLYTLVQSEPGVFTGVRNASGIKSNLQLRVIAPNTIETGPIVVKVFLTSPSTFRLSIKIIDERHFLRTVHHKEGSRWVEAQSLVYSRLDGKAEAATLAELQTKGKAFQRAYNEQAEAEERARRGAFWAGLGQLAGVAIEAYGAGMQEANEANARSQAIIDAAAESDRQYRAAQRVTELPRHAGQQSNSPPQAQAPVRPATPPDSKSSTSSAALKSAAAGGASGQGGMRSRSARVYFTTGLVPTASNTRNPLCYSNTITVTFISDPNGWGDAGRAAEAAAPYAPIFRAKCERLGQVDPGMPGANIESVTSGWPYPSFHAEDRRVTIP